MKVGNMKDLQGKVLQGDAVKNAAMQVAISPEEGWEGYVMRFLTLGEEGYSPKHTHDWPHINYMIEGEGVLMIDNVDYPVSAGSYSYVPGGKIHQFRNTGKGDFKFICIVPEEGHVY